MANSSKVRLMTYLPEPLKQNIIRISDEIGESMAATAKILIILGLQVYKNTKKPLDSEEVTQEIHIAKLS